MQTFVSYTRNKDTAGVVSRFSAQFLAELSIILPGSTIFFDKKNIKEGDHFPKVLVQEVQKSEVLIVLLSPAWLASTWCRKEFEVFTEDCIHSQRLLRIIPILWTNTPEVSENSLDPIAQALSRIHYADWRELRFESWKKAKGAKKVASLAEQVKKFSLTAFHPDINLPASASTPNRFPLDVEKLLILLAAHIDEGLHEDEISVELRISKVRVLAHLSELKDTSKLVRHLLRTTPGMCRWLLNPEGVKYLVRHDLVT